MPPRKSGHLVEAATALGATPAVPQEVPATETPASIPQNAEEAPAEEAALVEFRPYDMIHVEGTFNGWPVKYITAVDPNDLGVHLAGVTAALAAFGVAPRVGATQAPAPSVVPGNPAVPPAAAPGWNNTPVDQQGYQPQPQQAYAPPPPSPGYPPQQAAPGYGQQPACPTHGAGMVAMGNYGPYCKGSSPQPFPGSKPEPKLNQRTGQWTYYCNWKP